MYKPPKNLRNAKGHIYGRWGGCPEGIPYEEGRCAYAVWRACQVSSGQCRRKNGYGPGKLYCKTHAKKVKP